MIPEMQKFVELLESQLGYSEKSGGYTKFGDWYGRTVEFDADYTAAPWCDMYLSWAAKKLGYEEWIGQFAYTVYHAEWFRDQGAWGTVPKPGAIVFFDWKGSKKISGIDHVGVVTRVEGKRIHTIEGNIDGGVAKRKERDTGKVVGYGYPEKIKARLDREATEQETILAPATSGSSMLGGGNSGLGNSVAIGPGSKLLALVPDVPAPAPETPAPARPGKAAPAPKHAAKATAGNGGKATSPKTGAASTPKSDLVAAGRPPQAQVPAPTGGRTTPGKHAKAAAADTSALAVTPTATGRDLSVQTPDLSTPAVLAPVLLAAVAIIAHTKAKQSRVRLALAAERPAPAPSPRRTPGRRRASGRVTGHATGHAHGRVAAPGRTSAPYRGRRRLHERPVAQSSTFTRDTFVRDTFAQETFKREAFTQQAFMQDAPLRGRRHRRPDSVITTTVPATPITPARSTMPAHSAFNPATATAATVVRSGQSGHGVSSGSPVLPVEPGDVLVHSGYRGRRRAKTAA